MVVLEIGKNPTVVAIKGNGVGENIPQL
jgi:hypothetical protein